MTQGCAMCIPHASVKVAPVSEEETDERNEVQSLTLTSRLLAALLAAIKRQQAWIAAMRDRLRLGFFQEKIEDSFMRDFEKQSQQTLRLALLLSAVIIAAYLVIDFLSSSSTRMFLCLFFGRLLLCGFCGVAYAASYFPPLGYKNWQPFTFFCCFSISVAGSLLPAVYSRVAGFLALFLLLSLTSGFIRLRFIYACLILVSTISVYIVVGHYIHATGTLVDKLHESDEQAFLSTASMLMLLVASWLMLSSYLFESFARTQFLIRWELTSIEMSNLIAEQACDAKEAKSAFMSNMSHEIRHPIIGIVSCGELLSSTELTTEQSDYAAIMQRAAEGLLSLINDVLEWSKLEARCFNLNVKRFDLLELIEDTAEMVAPAAYSKGLEMVTIAKSWKQRTVLGDPLVLQSILVNLLDNAVKFTKTGGVSLIIEETTSSSPETTGIRFSILDTGIGIPHCKMKMLFHEFSQVDMRFSRETEGLGLGLALVLGFVKLMGGQLGVSTNAFQERNIPTGSVFWFEVPLSASPERFVSLHSQNDNRAALDQSKVCVLCLSTSSLVREMLKTSLEGDGPIGWTVIVGDSLEVLLKDSRYRESDWDCTVILTQHYEVYQSLSETIEQMIRGSVRWLMLTKTERRKHRGFFGNLEEPVRKAKLAQAVLAAAQSALLESSSSRIMTRGSRRSSSVGSTEDASKARLCFDVTSRVHNLPAKRPMHIPENDSEPKQATEEMIRRQEGNLTGFLKSEDSEKNKTTPKQNRVLLVDDTKVTQRLSEQTLIGAGFLVEVADNGLEAVEKWREKEFDVIVMDIEMEVMDGYEAAQTIRKEEIVRNRKRVPIIALTAHDSLGPKGFLMNNKITRPVSRKVLVDTVSLWARGFQLNLLDVNQSRKESLIQRDQARRRTQISDFNIERALGTILPRKSDSEADAHIEPLLEKDEYLPDVPLRQPARLESGLANSSASQKKTTLHASSRSETTQRTGKALTGPSAAAESIEKRSAPDKAFRVHIEGSTAFHKFLQALNLTGPSHREAFRRPTDDSEHNYSRSTDQALDISAQSAFKVRGAPTKDSPKQKGRLDTLRVLHISGRKDSVQELNSITAPPGNRKSSAPDNSTETAHRRDAIENAGNRGESDESVRSRGQSNGSTGSTDSSFSVPEEAVSYVDFKVSGDYSWKLGDSKWPASLVIFSLASGMFLYTAVDYLASGYYSRNDGPWIVRGITTIILLVAAVISTLPVFARFMKRNSLRGEICLAGLMIFTLLCLLTVCYLDEKLKPLDLVMWLSMFYLLVCINLFCRFGVSAVASICLVGIYEVGVIQQHFGGFIPPVYSKRAPNAYLSNDNLRLIIFTYFSTAALLVWSCCSYLLERSAIKQLSLTESVKNAHEARKRAAKAEAASLATTQFLATLNHEIRTPLAAIIGMADLLMDSNPELDKMQKELLHTVQQSSNQLSALIDQVLDLNRIEDGHLDLKEIGLDLRAHLEETATSMSHVCFAKNVELFLDVRLGHVHFLGDPMRLRQMLTNFLSNAIKFTDKGQIRISIATIEETASGALLRVSCTDSGRGVSPMQLEQLFVRFRQASDVNLTDSISSQKRGQIKGTGLGLSIVKMLAERMGGSCGMSSDPGQGSDCWFTVRLMKTPSVGSTGQFFRRETAPCRVLVCHRLALVGTVLCRYLAEWGYDASMATGVDNIGAVLGKNSDRIPFQIVVLDCALLSYEMEDLIRSGVKVVLMTNPGMTRVGLENERLDAIICRKPVRYVPFFEAVSSALRGNRSRRPTGDDPNLFGGPIVSARSSLVKDPLAENGLSGKRLHSLKARAEEIALPDPIVTDFPAADQLPGFVSESATEEEGAEPEKKPIRVLVVEDHLVNQRIVCTMLRKMDAEVEVANNGLEAVAAAEKNVFDLILMDCQMPVMDGFTATQQIRKRETGTGSGHVCIVALTAMAMPGDRERCLDAGMDDYMMKPVKKDVLKQMIEKMCRT